AFALLLAVAVTPSFDGLHNVCAFALLGLVGAYYTTWLNLEKPSWRWPHLAVMSILIAGAALGTYGFWQKLLILYVVLLINVQYSHLTIIFQLDDPDRSTDETWGGMRTWSALFVLAMVYAHRRDVTLDLPLSMFRDAEQRFIGAMLFLLL